MQTFYQQNQDGPHSMATTEWRRCAPLTGGDIPADTPLPLHIREDADRLVIAFGPSRRETIQGVCLMFLVCGPLWGLAAAIYGYLRAVGASQWEQPQALMFLFTTAPLYVGACLWVTYGLLAAALNHTHIEVDGMQLAVRHHPMPWPGRRLDPATIDQVYCQWDLTRTPNAQPMVAIELRARLLDGQDRKLLSDLSIEQLDQAQALEQRIEHWLGIADRPINGQITPT